MPASRPYGDALLHLATPSSNIVFVFTGSGYVTFVISRARDREAGGIPDELFYCDDRTDGGCVRDTRSRKRRGPYTFLCENREMVGLGPGRSGGWTLGVLSC